MHKIYLRKRFYMWGSWKQKANWMLKELAKYFIFLCSVDSYISVLCFSIGKEIISFQLIKRNEIIVIIGKVKLSLAASLDTFVPHTMAQFCTASNFWGFSGKTVWTGSFLVPCKCPMNNKECKLLGIFKRNPDNWFSKGQIQTPCWRWKMYVGGAGFAWKNSSAYKKGWHSCTTRSLQLINFPWNILACRV